MRFPRGFPRLRVGLLLLERLHYAPACNTKTSASGWRAGQFAEIDPLCELDALDIPRLHVSRYGLAGSLSL